MGHALWLLGGILFGIIHISAAFYLATRLGNTDDEALAHLRTAYKRALYLLCHDPWIAVYILILIAYLVFLGYGQASLLDFDDDNDDNDGEESDCSDRISQSTSIALICGWCFVVVGGLALAMSLCCACCDTRDYSKSEQQQQANNNSTTSQRQQQQQQQQHQFASQRQQQQHSTSTTTGSTRIQSQCCD